MHTDLQDLGKDIDVLTRDAWRLEPGVVEAYAPRPLAFRRVVLAVDDSKASHMAAAWARELAVVHRARVWVVTVAANEGTLAWYAGLWGQAGLLPPAGPLDGTPAAERLVSGVAEDLRKSGLAAEGVVLRGGAVAELVAFAKRNRADLVVLGSRDHEKLDRLLLGSVADGVKDHVGASVLLARNWPLPRAILIATDGSRPSKRAAAVALRLAKAWKAAPSLVHVVPGAATAPEGRVRVAYERVVGHLGLGWSQLPARVVVEVGPPAERIVAAAEAAEAGLVVMGSRGLSGLRTLVAGSVSDRVAHTARASVLLVKTYRAGGESR